MRHVLALIAIALIPMVGVMPAVAAPETLALAWLPALSPASKRLVRHPINARIFARQAQLPVLGLAWQGHPWLEAGLGLGYEARKAEREGSAFLGLYCQWRL